MVSCFVLFGRCLVVSTSTINCLEETRPEITNYVWSGALNSTHSYMYNVYSQGFAIEWIPSGGPA